MMEFRQDTEFEILGQFVNAGGSLDDGVSGKIIYKKGKRTDELELEIYGQLFDSELEFNLDGFNKSYKIIGFTNNGFTVIIDRAVKKKASESYPGIPYTKYGIARCLFLRINYEKSFDVISNQLSDIGIDKLDIKSCEYSFDGIDEWIDESKVKYIEEVKKYIYQVDFNDVDEDIFLVPDKNLKLSSGIEVRTGDIGFEEKFYWNLESIDKQDFNIKSVVDNLKIFKELMEIFITVPIDFSYIKFKMPIKQMDDKIVTGYLVNSKIHVENYRKKNTDIPYKKIKDNFEEILCNWYGKRNKLALISQNYIINKYAHQYNQSVLLNSIKNLEIYHRNFVEQKVEISESLIKDREIVLDFINNSIDDEGHRKKFERNINYDSELSLNNRLKELFKGLNDTVLNKLVNNGTGSTNRKISRLAQKLVDTRNYYVHGDQASMKDLVITDSSELVEITILLNQVIKYYICKELFELDDEIINIITKGMLGLIK